MLTGKKVGGRKIRHLRIRTRVIGTAGARGGGVPEPNHIWRR
jgi:hypothetical protein